MPIQLSYNNIILTMNGERVVGLSEDDNPIELPDIELITDRFGRDGTLFVMGTSRQGGEVKVKLLPTSPTVKNWMIRHAEIQKGARIIWRGTLEDTERNFSIEMFGGFLKMAPPGVVPGADPEFVFVFEQLIPNFDNAQFAPSPLT